MPTVPATEELTHMELEHWLHTVGIARYHAYDLNPADVFTADEVRQAVAERLHSSSKAV